MQGRVTREEVREPKRAAGRGHRHQSRPQTTSPETERHLAALRARVEQLERANRKLDDFACVAAHDLKQPLDGMRAYCELLLEDCHDRLDPVGRRRLAALGTMCDRLGGQIESLLAFCRAGRISSPQAEVDLGQVAAEVLQTLRPAIQQRGASVRVDPRLPVVSGDATLIGMVLANLVTNALKFNDRARPQVEIGWLARRPAVICVRDDGIGIAREHHEAVFEVFRRLHGRKKYQGSGAGLAIVRKIVEAHGGRVWLDSESGRGSTFYFTLAPDGEPAATPAPHWIARAATHGQPEQGQASTICRLADRGL